LDQQHTIFIAGCGYTGIRTARVWCDAGHPVYGLLRSPGKQTDLEHIGITPILADLDSSVELTSLPIKDAILYYFIPPPKTDRDTRIRRFLDSLRRDSLPQRIIYISTTGVYGDTGGGWVNEDTPPHPQTARAKLRLDAEKYLRQWAEEYAVEYLILRVAGIYGPGRLPVENIKQKAPILLPEEAPFSNRIHADDLAHICLQAATAGKPNTVYNVSDGNPGTVTDYYYTLADLLRMERPPALSMAEAEQVMSPIRLSFLRESRRIDNSKLLRELEIELLHPNLESGVRASLEEMGLPTN